MNVLKLAMAILPLTLLCACTDPDAATKETLTGMGYHDVVVEDGGFIATFVNCKKDDNWGRTFTAVGPTGVPIRGTACGGFLFHGTTIRFG